MMDTLYYLFCIKEVINLTAVVSVLCVCVCVGGLMCEMVCGGVRDGVCGVGGGWVGARLGGGGGSMRDGVLMYTMRVLLRFLYCSAL